MLKEILGETLMVIVPHEDDEINCAGATILAARREGLRVLCVFITNGDWVYPVSVREREAEAALAELGVPSEDIVFLGYPDGGVHTERSVFMHGRGTAVDVFGQRETYGTDAHPDYAMKAHGRHTPYTYEGLLSDLEAVISDYRPDALIVTDFDSHPDHRMCSLAFETVMGRILSRAGNNYRPVVLKSFAYATAFESVRDFLGRHPLSTKVNRECLRYSDCETDNPVYEWEKRLRVPAPADCMEPDLKRNPVFRALTCHMSQKALRRAPLIMNGDQVFFLRRTDNLALRGKIKVSSGNGAYLHDFRMMGTRDIAARRPPMEDYLWIPDETDEEKCCRCTFDTPRHIEKISLYGNIEDDGRVEVGELRFSNGFTCAVGALAPQGHETEIFFPTQDSITWVEFRIKKSRGAAGISEWEIFEKAEPPVRQLQLCADGNLAEEWAVWPDEASVVGAYIYGMTGDVRWFLDGRPATLEDINAAAAHLGKEIHVRAEQDGLSAELRLFPANHAYRAKHRLAVWKSRWQYKLENWRQARPHHKLKSLKRK